MACKAYCSICFKRGDQPQFDPTGTIPGWTGHPPATPAPPRFTGFDGIPDWTEKDSKIAAYESERKDLFSNIESLQAQLKAEREKTTSWYESWKAKSDRYDEVVRRVFWYEKEAKKLAAHQPVLYLKEVVQAFQEILA